ncbi:Transposon Tf2-11 polyprotein-like protein [Cladobotryum mycophilum]|uniref:Transposon Tf2-11 polyprotein-like protein n=1 Tax=Cladobotryum mycophilum TaxID=491253 RepID=A0ABR0S9H8_9HYPO
MIIKTSIRRANQWQAASALGDTGSRANLMHIGLLPENVKPRIKPTTEMVVDVQRNPIQVYGEVEVVMKITDSSGIAKIRKVPFVIAEIPFEPLILGKPWFNEHNPWILNWEDNFWVHPPSRDNCELVTTPKAFRRAKLEARAIYVLTHITEDPQEALARDFKNLVLQSPGPPRPEQPSNEKAARKWEDLYPEYTKLFDMVEARKLAKLSGRTHKIDYLTTKPKLSARQVSALDELCPFDFRIEHRPGSTNPADALSRRPEHYNADEIQEARHTQLPMFLAKFAQETALATEGRLAKKKISESVNGSRATSAGSLGPRSVSALEEGTTRGMLGDGEGRLYRSGSLVRRLRLVRAAGKTPTAGHDNDELGEPLESALRRAQEADPEAKKLLEKLRGGSELSRRERRRWRLNDKGSLLLQDRLYVPVGMRKEILMLIHDDPAAGHQGVTRTLKRARLWYTWPGMREDIVEHIRFCHECQTSKGRQHLPYGELAALPIPNEPFEEISMDFITGLPSVVDIHGRKRDAILVIVDRLTKYCVFVATSKSLTAEGLANILLDKIFRDYGIPEGIVTDRGSLFTSGYWRTFCHLIAMKRRLSTAFHPQTDGQTERMNQGIEHYLRTYGASQQDDWVDWLPLAQFAYNTGSHASTGESPAKALRGYEPRGPGAAREDLRIVNEQGGLRSEELRKNLEAIKERLAKAQETYAKYYNKKHINKQFELGQKVLLSTKNLKLKRPSKKLAAKYLGPYEITRVIGDHKLAYELELPKTMRIHNVFPISVLEEYRGDASARSQEDNLVEEDEVFDIERLIAHKGNKGRKYLVKWVGYPDSENSWVPRKDFTDRSIWQEYDRLVQSEAAAKQMRNS